MKDYKHVEYYDSSFTYVEDLFEADYAYAEDIDKSERYEIRRKGERLGRFETLDEAKAFLDGHPLDL